MPEAQTEVRSEQCQHQILAMLHHPLVYLLMIIPISVGITTTIVRLNVREYPRVVLYVPFIFLSKVAYHLGIWQWILHGHPAQPPGRASS